MVVASEALEEVFYDNVLLEESSLIRSYLT
jgi:hypothetical protein